MVSKPELLSPAGDPERLQMAVGTSATKNCRKLSGSATNRV